MYFPGWPGCGGTALRKMGGNQLHIPRDAEVDKERWEQVKGKQNAASLWWDSSPKPSIFSDVTKNKGLDASGFLWNQGKALVLDQLLGQNWVAHTDKRSWRLRCDDRHCQDSWKSAMDLRLSQGLASEFGVKFKRISKDVSWHLPPGPCPWAVPLLRATVSLHSEYSDSHLCTS